MASSCCSRTAHNCGWTAHLAGRPVRNPTELLTWLQGSGCKTQPAVVVAPDPPPTPDPAGTIEPSAISRPPGNVELDYVGSVQNAATAISSIHRGEKRLEFCDSRKLVEQIGAELRARGVTTFLFHASLSAAERRRSELAFVESRDCVIVSTSTLELGIDVGDLDRVIQVNSPPSVASFLQRLGRTGRRQGVSRNALFLP